MTKSTSVPLWMELTLTASGQEIRVSASSSRPGERVADRPLGITLKDLQAFAASVQQAASRGAPLTPLVAEAQRIEQAVLGGEIGALFNRLQEAAGGPLLVKVFVHDAALQAIPWEALCKPKEALGFWGSSARLFPVRGVASSGPWQPREIRSAVRVLAIAPMGGAGLENLRVALEERIKTGEVEWLEPVQGIAAKVPATLERLGRERVPHVIHFLGHGGLDKDGLPALRLADQDGEETWLPAELLAQTLAKKFQDLVRLVVLEACEGAKPSAFASAAEILARAGADAVVAHLWPVETEVARVCSTAFYRALVESASDAGDVAAAMNAARLTILGTYESSAEAMSPVVYLRGPEGRIFDFRGRKVTPPRAPVVSAEAGEVPAGLAKVLRAPFSLVLGDRWQDELHVLDKFRDKLQKALAEEGVVPRPGLPMSTLAQWFALRRGVDPLGDEFEETFPAESQGPSVVEAIARHLCPGVHITLMRNPWLELSLAKQQPERTVYVVQPRNDNAIVFKREAGTDKWNKLSVPPTEVDLDEEILVLRPYRGYTPQNKYIQPLLTEDDYHLQLREPWNPKVFPSDLSEAILEKLQRPALLLGLSLLTANHRILLHNVYPRSLPHLSLAVVEEVDREGKIWQAGRGLPGNGAGIEVLELPSRRLVAMLVAIAEARGI